MSHVRRGRGEVRRDEGTNLSGLLRSARDDTGHEVVVTAEELGSRVVRDVDAHVERSLQIRRHHRVVRDDQRVLETRLPVSILKLTLEKKEKDERERPCERRRRWP